MSVPERYDKIKTVIWRLVTEKVLNRAKGFEIMAEMINDKTMDEIEILAKLHLTEEEKEKSRQDLQQMLDYVDMLNKLDTSDVEPLTHIFPIKNVFREDVVLESTPKEELLKNAPKEKDGQFLVPKTIG